MTPVPRGLARTLGALAVLAAVLATPVPAGAAGPLCAGEEATLVVAEPGLVSKGTDGRDVIVGTSGSDTIYGLGGDDLICAGAGDDLALGGRGDDEVHGEGGGDLIFGNLGDDTLTGGEGSDQISGDQGKDTLYGDAGTDVLFGGDGPDLMWGGPDGDKLYGEAGRDRLHGGDGGDELQGGSEGDRLFGDDGSDYLWGDEGDDTLTGGADDDLLQGGPGADDLRGRGGSDELWGGECGDLAGVVNCREVPSGRPDGDPTVDPGDTYLGGPGVDACNKSSALPAGCDTWRGEHGLPSIKETTLEWWDEIVRAFEERAASWVAAGRVDVADALLAEVEHAKQIASCESLGDVFQRTPSPPPVGTTVDGLFQHKSRYWPERAAGAGYPGGSVFDPLTNARVAAWMVGQDIAYDLDHPVDPPRVRHAWIDWACDEWLTERGLWE